MYPVSNRPTMIQLLLLAVILLQAAASAESNCPDSKCLMECKEFEKGANGCCLCECAALPSMPGKCKAAKGVEKAVQPKKQRPKRHTQGTLPAQFLPPVRPTSADMESFMASAKAEAARKAAIEAYKLSKRNTFFYRLFHKKFPDAERWKKK